MEYCYPQHLPGGTHLFSPSFFERETIRFHVAACKDKSTGGLRVFCSWGVAKSKGLRLWFGTSAHESDVQDTTIFVPWLVHFWASLLLTSLPVWCSPLSSVLLTTASLPNRWLFPCSTYGSSSLRNPLEGLSCLHLAGAFPHPNLLRSYYESFQSLLSMNIWFWKDFKSQ